MHIVRYIISDAKAFKFRQRGEALVLTSSMKREAFALRQW